MAKQRKLEKCGGLGPLCACGNPSTETSHIENDLFEDLWISLSGKSCFGQGRGVFHFHILEGWRKRGASLGYSGKADGSDASALQAAETAVNLALDDHKGTIFDLVKRIADAGTNPQALFTWAKETFRAHGQELGEIPSRLEQCLTIKTALERDVSFKVGAPLFIAEARAEEGGDERSPGYFQIDNYLQPNMELAQHFQEACRRLGASQTTALSGELPASRSALKFLLAECFHLWNGSENLSEFSERLVREPPGLAIVPVRILGQYRAAASWFYSGRLCEACELRDHISVVAKEVRRWMEPAFDRTMLSATSYRLLQVLVEYSAPEGVPIIGRCRRAQQALCDLWFANEVAFVTGEKSAAWKQEAPLPYLKTPTVTIEVKIAERAEAIKLLGFEKIVFKCPLFPNECDREAVAQRVERALNAVEDVARGAQERIARRAHETTEKQLAVVAHDLANAMSDITFLSAPSRDGEKLNALRLSAIHQTAEYLSTHAWLIYGMSHAFDGTIRSSSIADELLQFVERPPNKGELDQWSGYLAAMIQGVAMAARWKDPPRPELGESGTLTVRFQFNEIDAQDASHLHRWDRQIWQIEKEAKPILRPDFTAGQSGPIWPFHKSVRRINDRPGEQGRIALIMYGAVELIRNACKATVQIKDGDECVDVDSTFFRYLDRWELNVKTTNRCTTSRKRDINQIPSAMRIQGLAPSIIKFANEPADDGYVSYSYTLTIRPGLASSGGNDD